MARHARHDPQIIDPVAMICMIMRPKNGIYRIDLVGEQLRATIR